MFMLRSYFPSYVGLTPNSAQMAPFGSGISGKLEWQLWTSPTQLLASGTAAT